MLLGLKNEWAPSVADVDGDGTLEIVLLTFDHGVDVFNVPGSGSKCLPWPTGRGNLLRNGQGPATVPGSHPGKSCAFSSNATAARMKCETPAGWAAS
jgi:hypothetical protein